jgi:hypothetical protein
VVNGGVSMTRLQMVRLCHVTRIWAKGWMIRRVDHHFAPAWALGNTPANDQDWSPLGAA